MSFLLQASIVPFVIKFLLDNIWFIYSIFLNMVLFVILVRLAVFFGPFFGQTFRASLGLIKNPILLIDVRNARRINLQIRSYSNVLKVEPEDPNSDFLYVDRKKSYYIGSYEHESKGIFGFFKKKTPGETVRTSHNQNYVVTQIKPKAEFRSWGMPAHFLLEGEPTTVDPLENKQQSEQIKAASMGVMNTIEAFKILFLSRFQEQMPTKKDIWVSNIVTILIPTICIIMVIVILLGFRDNVTQFIGFLQEFYNNAEPAIQQFIRTYQPLQPVPGSEVIK